MRSPSSSSTVAPLTLVRPEVFGTHAAACDVELLPVREVRYAHGEGAIEITNADDESSRTDLGAQAGEVFHLEPFVADEGGLGGDALGGSEEPEEEIDLVDALVHEATATIDGACAAPGAAGVILLRPVPLNVGVAQDQLAEAARIEGVAHGRRSIGEAILKNAA